MELSFLRFGLGPTFPDGEKKITLQIFVTKLCNRRAAEEGTGGVYICTSRQNILLFTI